MPASLQLEVEAVDLVVENHGRFFLMRSYTVEGGAFLMEASDDALYLRNALKVDPRYIKAVVDLARRKGLSVR